MFVFHCFLPAFNVTFHYIMLLLPVTIARHDRKERLSQIIKITILIKVLKQNNGYQIF